MSSVRQGSNITHQLLQCQLSSISFDGERDPFVQIPSFPHGVRLSDTSVSLGCMSERHLHTNQPPHLELQEYPRFAFIPHCQGSSGPFTFYVNFGMSLPSSPESTTRVGMGMTGRPGRYCGLGSRLQRSEYCSKPSVTNFLASQCIQTLCLHCTVAYSVRNSIMSK